MESLNDHPIKVSMKVEVVDRTCVSAMRVATVDEIIGGRLRLQYVDNKVCYQLAKYLLYFSQSFALHNDFERFQGGMNLASSFVLNTNHSICAGTHVKSLINNEKTVKCQLCQVFSS